MLSIDRADWWIYFNNSQRCLYDNSWNPLYLRFTWAILIKAYSDNYYRAKMVVQLIRLG